jgi:murein DD-endopeptidase MepM/ murein hydrolase activator NlpD
MMHPLPRICSLRRAALAISLGGLLVGCARASAISVDTPQPSSSASSTRLPSATHAAPLSETVTAAPSADRSTPTADPTATEIPTPCGKGWCAAVGHFLLSRPITGTYGAQVDPTYRYASTNGGTRAPHSGVEFQAPAGETVYSAGDGEVMQAGKTLTAPFTSLGDEYGNLVIIRHAFPDYPLPIYTLYGHLSQVDVQVGQKVSAGDPIGRVGETGIATGPHLHFEVRVGADPLPGTRNPELWLLPAIQADQVRSGAIAGRITRTDGSPLLSQSIVLQRITSGGLPAPLPDYLNTYDTADTAAFPEDDTWHEDFAAGDLAPGLYRISVMADGRLNTGEVQIFPNRITIVNFEPDSLPTQSNGE